MFKITHTQLNSNRNHLIRKWTTNHSVSLAKWYSFRLQSNWLWVQIQLKSLNFFLNYRLQIHSKSCNMIRTDSQPTTTQENLQKFTNLQTFCEYTLFLSNAFSNSASVLLKNVLNWASNVAKVLLNKYKHHHSEIHIFAIFAVYLET